MSSSMFSRELSLSLGMSKDYLCVYRTFNRHLKSYDEAYHEVIKRRQDDEDTINKLRLENDSLKARIELTELLNSKSVFTFDERC